MADALSVNAARWPPTVVNEPVRQYAPGSPERADIEARLASMSAERADIPGVVAGKAIRSGRARSAVMPCAHAEVIAHWHAAGARDVTRAIDAATRVYPDWSSRRLEDRAAVFLRAADLLSTTHRATVNAATMLGQGKTVYQAEIDAACELADFWRFNARYAAEIARDQPASPAGVRNSMDYRPLEGFVYAVTPFNFTSIAGNLPTAPALMGNVVLWKPASSAIPSAYVVMRVLEEAGLPPGVINFVPGDAEPITVVALASTNLAGIHFTGSTAVFRALWGEVGANLARYRSFPRLVGETGGKDFILLHPSADLDAAATAIVRGGFEYQGQKCSAASRVYVPRSIWPAVRDRVVAMMKDIAMGDVRDLHNFMGAVIDRRAFDRITTAIRRARRTATIVCGGGADRRIGFFVEPTLVRTSNPSDWLMREEIFGPVVTVYVYPDRRWHETLALVDGTSPYALTGAVFAGDRHAIDEAAGALRHAAGNFYVNDKPTGAVVDQQPFGGARASGTNDKAGSKLNLVRWTSARTIKENLDPSRTYRYPHME